MLPAFTATSEDDQDEPWDELDAIDPARGRWVSVSPGAPGAREVIWSQKPCIADWLWPQEAPPAHIVLRYGLPTVDVVDFVLQRLDPSRVILVTDLDPWGWVIARRVTALLAERSPGLPIIHRGVGDELISLSAAWRHLAAPDKTPTNLTFPLSPSEIERWRWLRPVAAPAMGPRSVALLDAGAKLEVEGATNPSCHRDGYASALRDWLLAPSPSG